LLSPANHDEGTSPPTASVRKRVHPAAWLFGVLAVFALAGVLLVALDHETRGPVQRVELPDGSRLSVAGVVYGSKHDFSDETRIQKFLRKWLPPVHQRLYPSGVLRFSNVSSEARLGIFLLHEDPAGTHDFFNQNMVKRLSSGTDWATKIYNSGSVSSGGEKKLLHFAEAVPLTRENFQLTMLLPDASNTTYSMVATLDLKNPAYQPAPTPLPPPSPMPVVINDGILSTTLLHVVAGTGGPDYNPERGPRDYEDWDGKQARLLAGKFFPPAPDGDSRTVIMCQIESLAHPGDKWQLNQLIGRSSTGMQVKSGGLSSRPGDAYHVYDFTSSMVQEAGPYDLDLQFVKHEGYRPHELMLVDTEIPTTGSAPVAGARAVINGSNVVFEGLAGADFRSTGSMNLMLSSRDKPIVLLSYDQPPGKMIYPRLIAAVDALGIRYGYNMSTSGHSVAAPRYTAAYELRPNSPSNRHQLPVSPAGTSITLTFALSEGHTLKTRLTPWVP